MTQRDGAHGTGTLRAAQIIAGKYVVEHALGTGGMGLVVAARHLQLGRRVAVKVLRSQVRDDPEQVTRLLREARSAGAIHSEHVVQILDVGALDSGSPFVVMEYLEGEDLEVRFRRIGPMPVDEAVDYVLQACAAVGAAHAIGIIHRDIKPANLFLTTSVDGRPLIKILDFGISKASSLEREGEQKLTATGASMGSPVYMSPEQVKGDEADARTDLWGLGTALYELLTAHTPFEATKVGPLYAKILGEPPTPLRAWRSDVPPGLEAVILQCLEKDMRRRFDSAAALAAALVPFATRHLAPSVSALVRQSTSGPARRHVPQVPQPEIIDEPTIAMPNAFAVTNRERKPKAALLAIGAGAVLAALIFALFVVLRRSPEPKPAPAASATAEVAATAPPIASASAPAAAAPEASAAPSASAPASASARPAVRRPSLQIIKSR